MLYDVKGGPVGSSDLSMKYEAVINPNPEIITLSKKGSSETGPELVPSGFAHYEHLDFNLKAGVVVAGERVHVI